MAIAQAVTCDVCGKVKGEVNHWWLFIDSAVAFHVYPWDEDHTSETIGHLCGQDCVIKALNKWMQTKQAA